MSSDNQPPAAPPAKPGSGLAAARAAEDDATAQARLKEDQATADKRAGEDRELASAGHRLFLAAAALTAAVNTGDLTQVSSANTELQEAVDAHLALGKPERGETA
jgi:hypothetical protein